VTLYCEDEPCPECHEEPVMLRCALCNVRGLVVDCGHLDWPRPLSPSQGVDWPLIVCHGCELRQEKIVELAEVVMPIDADDMELTLFRRAVNIALRLDRQKVSVGSTLSDTQAVYQVWNNGRWQAGIQDMLNREAGAE